MPIILEEFRKNLIYTAKASVISLIADLQEIREIDQLAEAQQQKYTKQAWRYFLGAIASLFLIFFIANLNVKSSFLSLILLILLLFIIGLIIAFTYALIKRAKFARINILNYRYEVTLSLITMLARDMGDASEVDLKISFKPTVSKETKVETIPHPRKNNWKIDKHENEWLKLQGQFLDKTHFLLTATELSKTQYGWKRSVSGKSKYKTKTNAVGLDVCLTLNYPQRRYAVVNISENDIQSAIKLPNLSYMKGLRVTDKIMQMKVRMAPQVADNSTEIYQTVTMMFLSFYEILNLAKAISKQSKS
jgi:energy-coupling factor transporter transmembrane protein EcfT